MEKSIGYTQRRIADAKISLDELKIEKFQKFCSIFRRIEKENLTFPSIFPFNSKKLDSKTQYLYLTDSCNCLSSASMVLIAPMLFMAMRICQRISFTIILKNKRFIETIEDSNNLHRDILQPSFLLYALYNSFWCSYVLAIVTQWLYSEKFQFYRHAGDEFWFGKLALHRCPRWLSANKQQ